MIGTKPAADTRFGSSNIADPTVNACDDCTGNAFRTRDYFDFDNRYCPSSGGIFAVHTPITNDRPSTDSGLDAEEAPLRPWIATLKPLYVRVIASEITGRRFKFGPEPHHETTIG
jgi:hypothetical protein